jgi:hypothetical protein
MTVSCEATARVGQEVRTLNWAWFRRGRWALIVAAEQTVAGTDRWLVRWPDGETDWWKCNDRCAEYQFRDRQPVDSLSQRVDA